MKEYRFKYRGSATVLKLIDENRVAVGFRIYAGYIPFDWGDIPDRIEGAYYIRCNSNTCDEPYEMKLKMLMWDQPNREA